MVILSFDHLDVNLRRSVERSPDALVYSFAGRTVTYAQFDAMVSRFSGALYGLGLRQGDGLAIIMPNSDAFLLAYHGAFRNGMYCVPMNPLYTPNEILFMLKDSGVKAVVAPAQLASMAGALDAMLPGLKLIAVGADKVPEGIYRFEDLIAHAPMESVDYHPTLNNEDTAVILYTSGTTGAPKGAMLSHRNLSSNAMTAGEYLDYSERDRVVTVLPIFHVFSLTVCVNTSIFKGAQMLLLARFSPLETLALIQDQRATIFAGVPTMYNFMMQAAGDTSYDLGSLRYCLSGGAGMPVAVMEAFEKRFDVRILEGYGLSEASPVTAFTPVDGRPRKVGSIGISVPLVEQKVFDENDNEVPVGEIGELVVRGPNVMKGYLHRPEETQQVLRGGWLHTGDLARMDEDGYFYIVDRKKDMILVGGFNVYPREVEEVLFHMDGIVEVAVIGAPNDEYGEEVVAFIVRNDERLDEAAIREYCKENLAKYKQPKRYIFTNELPKNMTGKVMRRELRESVAK